MHYQSHELTMGLSFLLGIIHVLEPGHCLRGGLIVAVGAVYTLRLIVVVG